MADSDETGLLTQNQREFLRTTDPDMSDRGVRAAKSRIRKRIQVAFDDLRLLFGTEETEQKLDLDKVLGDIDPGRVWPLSAILFMWSVHHPTLLNRNLDQGMSTPDKGLSTHEQVDRVTASFDSQVERGVRTALESVETDRIPEEVNNDLTISLGGSVADMSDEELAELSRRSLDLLFRRGDLDNAEYARIMKRKLADADEK
ncbi:hypothetical protein [Haloarcula salina]|uniref:Uncharacterized protein n=1 Tax=Haloarcula salina TaxID=1429914 RepID=A0AA41FX50_9EURY|nr:hypothetical protein [Haloarcula salina]MBV0900180.1 hypothetical protein [Haloarcula salina]